MEPVFVYGTLKRGFANAPYLPPHRFAGRATTTEPYPLVVAHGWFVPVLLDEPGSGRRVSGELLEVDADGLAFLDAFESVGDPRGYRRQTIAVTTAAGDTEAWAYLKDRRQVDVIHDGPMADYRPDHRYIESIRRGPDLR
jgi:gamma-glutamylaminecyclotransferase